MKKMFSLLTAALLLAGGISTSAILSTKEVDPIKVQAAGPGTYYDGISDSLTGDSLVRALNTLNNSKRKKTTGYDGMKTAAKVFDADPDGSGKIISFYTNQLIGPNWDSAKTWNREHVWPNARGGSKVEGDAHMTRPASTSINSERGSKGYSMQAYDPGQYVAYYRGMAARIIFYAAIADTNLKVIDEPLNYNGSTPANSMGSLSEMLKWNLEYRPDDTTFTGANDLARRTELNRNEQIQNASIGQGNRNPFIDHPEYACRIWGNTNSKTKEICAGVTPTPTPTDIKPTSLTLNKSSATVSVNETVQLSVASVTPDNADKSVTWSTNNSGVASVSTSGLVTALAEGNVVITATSTKDSSVKATCSITVSSSGDTPTPPSPTVVSVTSITLDKTSAALVMGDTLQLNATITPENATNKAIFWSTSNKYIATVTNTGLVTAVSVGTVTITATTADGNKAATCELTISRKESGGGSGSGDTKTSCGGNIIATSVILSSISLVGIALLLIKRFKEKR